MTRRRASQPLTERVADALAPLPPSTPERRRILPRWVKRADVRAARWVNRRHTHPAVDEGYRRLSRSANKGVLWFAIAGVLVLLGRRRAAVRGVASLTAASILANLVGKRLFGGGRPLLKDVPIGRQLAKTPTSPSFPSGHSASAVAFAAGVALEDPKAGAALAPIAAAVAYSRMHVGAHWLSDVVGGSALGVAVALVGRAIVPRPQRVPRAVRQGSDALEPLPALDGDEPGTGLFIVANPSSGRDIVGEPDPIERLGTRLPGAEVHVLAEGEDIHAVLRDRLDTGTAPTALGVVGGDGTVAAVAAVALDEDLPLLVVPGGTFNHFAQAAGLPSTDASIDAALAGTGVPARVARLTDPDGGTTIVLNTASVGLYPEFVAERERREDRLGKRVASLVAAVRLARKVAPVRVTVNGVTDQVWTLFVGVNRYTPPTAAPITRRRLDDGVLDIRVLHAGRRRRSRAVAGLGFGPRTASALSRWGLFGTGPLAEAHDAERIEFTVHPGPDGMPGVAHDGEARIPSPSAADPDTWVLEMVPEPLHVYAPQRRP